MPFRWQYAKCFTLINIIIDVAPPGADQRNPHSSHMSDKLPVCLSPSHSISVCLSVCQVLFPPFWLTCRCCFPARRISDRVAPPPTPPSSPCHTTVCWLLLSLIMISLCLRVCVLVCVRAFFLVVIVAKQQCDFTLVFLLAYLCV